MPEGKSGQKVEIKGRLSGYIGFPSHIFSLPQFSAKNYHLSPFLHISPLVITFAHYTLFRLPMPRKNNQVIYTGKSLGKTRPPDDIPPIDGTDYEAILSTIPLKVIVNHYRVRAYMRDQAEHRDAVRVAVDKGKQSMAYGYMVGLVYPLVIDKVRRMPSSPLNGLTPYQIHCLISVWLVCRLCEGVCRSSQVLPYNDRKATNSWRNQALKDLVELGFLEHLDALRLHRMTGKHKFHTNKAQYFGMTRFGVVCMDEFNHIFATLYKKITSDAWFNHLEKL